MAKTEAQLEAQQRAAATALADLRRPRVQAVIDALDEEGASLVERLKAARADLHDGQARQGLDSVVSIITSAGVMARSDMAKINASAEGAAS